jgi:hypothetical protein
VPYPFQCLGLARLSSPIAPVPMVPAMPAAVTVPVMITADAARPPVGPDHPAVRVIVIGIVAAIIGRLVAAAEEVPMVEVRDAEPAAMPSSTVPSSTVPTSAVPTAPAVPASSAAMPTAATAWPPRTSVVNRSDACFADGDMLGVISDIALVCLAGATANISSAIAATLRPRTRPGLECAIPVMVDVSLNAGDSKR